MVTLYCEKCNKEFKRRQKCRFCSIKCYWEWKVGTKHSDEHRQKISEALKGKPKSEQHIRNVVRALEGKRVGLPGEKNPAWKGEKATYFQIHDWIKDNIGYAKECAHCGKVGLKNKGVWSIDWANISGEYKREMNDWVGLCRKCHIAFDKGKLKRVGWINRRPTWSK